MMTDKTSFEFFKWLLEYNRTEELKTSYSDYVSKYCSPSEFFDFQTGALLDWDTATGFSSSFKFRCLANVNLIRNSISLVWQDTSMTSAERNTYLQHHKEKAELYKSAASKFYPSYPFVAESLTEIINYIDNIDFIISAEINTNSNLSFKWIGSDEKLSMLYSLLTTPPAIIECSFPEFENAFRGKVVHNGIRWLKTTNRGEPLKSLLIYFVKELPTLDLIEEFEPREFNSRVCYVFRDSNGNEMQNFKQSKNQQTGSPLDKELIDRILDDITK